MSQDPPSGAARRKVSLSVTHVIENGDVRLFAAWAAGLMANEAGASAAGDAYFGPLPDLPMPDELLALAEAGSGASRARIRCVAFYYGARDALDLDLVTARLTLLWAASGAGTPVPCGTHVDLLHAAVEKFQVGGSGGQAHPHLPWVLQQIGTPVPAPDAPAQPPAPA
jgi:hypothetical protein